MKKDTITIFTDGSSRGNPGPGGWGALVIYPAGESFKVAELGGREDRTTNNRMEIAAAVGALSFIESRKIAGSTIEIHADSAYLLQGITAWVFGWEKNGWKTKTGDDVLNQDLWREIAAAAFRLKQKRELVWTKVSGHSGLRGNERADSIATTAADQGVQILFAGALSEYEKLIGGSVFENIGGDSPAPKKKKSSKAGPAYAYLSLRDGKIEPHKTWAECEARVKGKSGVKFKKVFSKEEEAALKAEWSKLVHKS